MDCFNFYLLNSFDNLHILWISAPSFANLSARSFPSVP